MYTTDTPPHPQGWTHCSPGGVRWTPRPPRLGWASSTHAPSRSISVLLPASPEDTLARLACVSSVHTPMTLQTFYAKAFCPTPGPPEPRGPRPQDRVTVFPPPDGLHCCGAFLETPPPHDPSLPLPPSTHLALPTGWVVSLSLASCQPQGQDGRRRWHLGGAQETTGTPGARP